MQNEKEAVGNNPQNDQYTPKHMDTAKKTNKKIHLEDPKTETNMII